MFTDTQVLLIGDSLTVYSDGFYLADLLGQQYEIHSSARVGTDFPYWTSRLDEVMANKPAPHLIIVLLGTNDGYAYAGNAFRSNVISFHEALLERVNGEIVYAQVPRTREPGLANQILANNQILKDLSLGKATMDLDAPLQSTSEPPFLYEGIDPIHPTSVGYRIIGETIASQIRF